MATSENTVIIIDEISVGLDHQTLLKILEQIKQLGYKNQIWLIDHSDTVLDSTDEQLFFGPGSGKYGGKIVEESPRLNQSTGNEMKQRQRNTINFRIFTAVIFK